MRGYSFKRKRLFQQAKEEFDKIDEDFDLIDLVNSFLGEIALELGAFMEAESRFSKVLKKDVQSLGIKSHIIESNLALAYLHQEKLDKQNTTC